MLQANCHAPEKICCGYKKTKTIESLCWYGLGDADHNAMFVTYQVRATYDGTADGGKGGRTQEHMFNGVFFPQHNITDTRLLTNHSSYGRDWDAMVPADLAGCFGPPRAVLDGFEFNEVSLADLVRYHSPPNKDVLLGHLEKQGNVAVSRSEEP